MYKFVCFIYSRSILYVKKQEIRNKIFPKEGVCPVCGDAKSDNAFPRLSLFSLTICSEYITLISEHTATETM